jgi:hypothetical protein
MSSIKKYLVTSPLPTFVSFVTATVLPSILLLQTISPHLVSCIIVYNIHFPESDSNIPSQTSAIVPTPSIPHCSADGLPLLLSGLPLFLEHWCSPHLHSAALADETPLLGFERPSFMHGLRVISLSTFLDTADAVWFLLSHIPKHICMGSPDLGAVTQQFQLSPG